MLPTYQLNTTYSRVRYITHPTTSSTLNDLHGKAISGKAYKEIYSNPLTPKRQYTTLIIQAIPKELKLGSG